MVLRCLAGKTNGTWNLVISHPERARGCCDLSRLASFPRPPTSKTKFQADEELLTGIALAKPALASTQPPSGSSGMDTDSGSPFYGGNVKLKQLPMKTMTKRPTRPTSAIVHVPEPFPRRGSFSNDANSGLYPTILKKRTKQKTKKKAKKRGLLSFYAIRRPSGRCFP
ncbi:hypothetical protein BDV37DRAFT_16413 [Aspergillus pseudonomiae]|uniref:Uncharacterized protein n=1 Tax=Aspergillus pseudonomiae TaxID=1506151 RepID=A0A5N7CXJ8_9EURO|nr:uncharacterized protein BDV37DRAFT_16413 [Aspergillus pseudonomiae]KAE8398912.1 hypothetical protein BDV37DRAFT_16413 [Aspergillus pseudonomiae]